MKKIIFVIFAFALLGCSAEQQRMESYMDDPSTILKDPHYTEYQEKMDSLESEYLSKKITYAEYLERKQKLEETYNKEVKDRNDIILPPAQ